MQAFNFGIRGSGADSMDDERSRYVPSSIYSGGLGPAEESPAPSTAAAFTPMALQGPFQEQQPRYNPLNQAHPRGSSLLNINDPVAMHLLMETAISDSRDYEILSFEEVESLKKERTFLRARVESAKRKLALESKLRDAAQSLNRLYSTRGRPPSGDFKSDTSGPMKIKRKSLLGSKNNTNDALSRADEEFAASSRKIEETTIELARLEKRLEECQKRILEHTAGILQMTHKGLKKNIRRTELPRSPESMLSQPNRSVSRMDGAEEFDERSLYQVPDYVTDFGHSPAATTNDKSSRREMQAIESMAAQLTQLNQRLHAMIIQSGPQEHFDPPPEPADEHIGGRLSTHFKAHLGYLSQGLDAMETAQARNAADAEKDMFGSEDQLENVNAKLHHMLQRTNSIGKSPIILEDEPRGKDIQSQLAFSAMVLDRLNSRVEALMEQKDILTRQIQQQRELNNKSDAQRDAQIHSLTQELSESKRLQTVGEQESHHTRDQIHLLIEQLDQAKQDNVLLEQQRGTNESKAVQAERDARHEVEKRLLADLQAKQDQFTRLEAEMAKLEHEFDIKSHHNYQQLTSLTEKRDQAELELGKARGEMERLESEVARVQTELTVVKAELDGAYGTRAQRAADVSMNPAIQGKIDDLQGKVDSLQKELKETIEDYEVMTKQSIEAEKARDQLEEKIDVLEQRCEGLESQLSEEKLKWLGVRSGAPAETTSTMVLKNEFKKMMRDTRTENVKALKAEQEERRRLETIIRGLRKDSNTNTPSKPNTRLQNVAVGAH